VLTPDGKTVAGYYTLSQYSVELGAIPDGIAAKLPKYPFVPATLIGRLAVSNEFRGQRLGELLLMDALNRCLRAANKSPLLRLLWMQKMTAQQHSIRSTASSNFPRHPNGCSSRWRALKSYSSERRLAQNEALRLANAHHARLEAAFSSRTTAIPYLLVRLEPAPASLLPRRAFPDRRASLCASPAVTAFPCSFRAPRCVSVLYHLFGAPRRAWLRLQGRGPQRRRSGLPAPWGRRQEGVESGARGLRRGEG